MKIAVVGTQNIGKTTVINDFVKKWKDYKVDMKSYRDIIVEKNLPINKETTPDTQDTIMEFICESLEKNASEDKFIMDRSPYDALVYSIWANGKEKEGFTDEFVQKQINIAREASKAYDIIFFIPIDERNDVKLKEDGVRDIDPDYRAEIDNIFKGIFGFLRKDGEIHQHIPFDPFFDVNDCPPVIPIYGDRNERIADISDYVNEDGEMYNEEGGVLEEYINEIIDG